MSTTASDSPEARSVGAYEFKDWNLTVWVTRGSPIFPAQCACCLSPEDLTESEVTLADRDDVRYPICTACERHAAFAEKALMVSLAAGLIGPALAYYALFGTQILRRGFTMTLLLYGLAVLGVAFLVYTPLSKFGPARTDDCTDETWPVSVDSAEDAPVMGENTTRTDEKHARAHSARPRQAAGTGGLGLTFANKAYGRAYLEANGGTNEEIPFIEAAL